MSKPIGNKPIEIVWEDIVTKLPKDALVHYRGNFKKIFLGYSKPISKLGKNAEERSLLVNDTLKNFQSRDEMLDFVLGEVLTKIAKLYIGKKNCKKENLKICCKIIVEHFHFLSVPEIFLAFELAFVGTIKVDVNLYGNEFGVAYVGKILRSYSNYRTAAVKIIRQLIRDYTSPKALDVEVAKVKNRQARERMADDIIKAYKDFFDRGSFSSKIGMKNFLLRLGYSFPTIKKVSVNQKEKVERVGNVLDRLRIISDTYDDELKELFKQIKAKGTTPKQFKDDLNSKFNNYENKNI